MLVILLGIGTVTNVATATAASSAPDRHGLIYACFGSSDEDELHLTPALKPCPQGEAKLKWNQRGRPGLNAGIGEISLGLTLSGDSSTKSSKTKSSSSWRQWIKDAATAIEEVLLLAGLGLLALAIALVPVGKLAGWPRRWPVLWRFRVFRWFGPGLQVMPFEDSAMGGGLGASFALQTQVRVGGGQEGGRHLYLVTGEQPAGLAVADLQAVPQTKALAAALALLQITWRRRRLIVSGSLMPADAGKAAAVVLSLRRDSKWVNDAELWPSEPPTANMTATTSNRVLAVAAAGWIEHTVVDQTPGPRSYEQFLSREPQSWALFRAGAELNRISCFKEAADHYERALAIDPDNIGALVDLAHLRRLDGYWEGAESLVARAIDLIEARSNRRRRARREDDPNWYRAQIVLTTIHAEWAKYLESENVEGDRARELREHAFGRAHRVATAAIEERSWLEGLVGAGELERAERGPKVRPFVRWRARSMAFFRGRRLDPSRAVESYVLLATTFEPGTLLLVAANCPNRASPPPAGSVTIPVDGTDENRRALARASLESARRLAREQLEAGQPDAGRLDPGPLISYIRAMPLKSPRVLYNIACHYSIAARAATPEQDDYLEIAFEYMRQAISRSPPLERLGLLKRMEEDDDLDVLRGVRGDDIKRLWELVPADPHGEPGDLS